MNGKPRHFLTTVLLLGALALSSCAKKKPVKTPEVVTRKPEQVISQVSHYILQGKYTEATATCNSFLQHNNSSSVLDRMLFHCGLLYAADPNPQKNINQALALLHQLSTDFPASDLAPNARIVVWMLESLRHLQSMREQLSKTASGQVETIKGLQEEIDRLNKRAARLVETLNQLQRSRSEQAKTIDDQASTIKELQAELDKIKRIDLKKRP